MQSEGGNFIGLLTPNDHNNRVSDSDEEENKSQQDERRRRSQLVGVNVKDVDALDDSGAGKLLNINALKNQMQNSFTKNPAEGIQNQIGESEHKANEQE